ncbi:MAG TPA: ABC transporter substrate-binding protein [Beijerinckiaceae bacterium]|jgi:branched-chain amino acid transport system substrate-binding protein|nr:ABC transporter substrate-binding protein [Beijerinckiaceae bacterium]
MKWGVALAALTAAAMFAGPQAQAQNEPPIKIGMISSQTGPFAAVGRQMEAGVRLYMQLHGDTVAGRKIELIVKDDTGVADTTRRLAQELVVNDKVNFLVGFTLTPGALATAPIATQGKTPMIVMLGATSIIPDRSPYIVRSMLSVAQVGVPFGEWIQQQGAKSIVTLVSDYGPGQDYENLITQGFEKRGGQVLGKLRVPLANPEFAPFLQKVIDLKPDALFVFVPSGGVGAAFMKQAAERGLAQSGIKVYTEGSIVEDDIVNAAGDIALGTISAHNYSAAHDSAANKAFVAAFKKANNRRPNFVAVTGYDGMHMIYEALKKTGGKGDGDALVKAMIGMEFESPRGPVKLDGETRDLIQNIYVRRTEKGADGELYNVEFATIPNVKDPTRPAK